MSTKIPLTLSFAKVANFLSVVGIIGSLIFIGLELRQNQKLAMTNAYQTRLSEMQQAMVNLALSKDLAVIMVKLKLNYSERELGRKVSNGEWRANTTSTNRVF